MKWICLFLCVLCIGGVFKIPHGFMESTVGYFHDSVQIGDGKIWTDPYNERVRFDFHARRSGFDVHRVVIQDFIRDVQYIVRTRDGETKCFVDYSPVWLNPFQHNDYHNVSWGGIGMEDEKVVGIWNGIKMVFPVVGEVTGAMELFTGDFLKIVGKSVPFMGLTGVELRLKPVQQIVPRNIRSEIFKVPAYITCRKVPILNSVLNKTLTLLF
jgi:hypothetical protein